MKNPRFSGDFVLPHPLPPSPSGSLFGEQGQGVRYQDGFG